MPTYPANPLAAPMKQRGSVVYTGGAIAVSFDREFEVFLEQFGGGGAAAPTTGQIWPR